MIHYNFVTIEGNIGAGKTTLATKLAEEYNARLILEQFADNSFLPKFYENPAKYAFALELSFLAERFQQLKNELAKQDIFQPKIVSDYYFLKSLIFAKANLEEDEYGLYSRLFQIINDSLPKPDLFVYLYQDINRLQTNIKKRGRSYEQNITDEYLIKIQTTYFDYIKQMKELRILIIDVNSIDFAANQQHYNNLSHIINQPYEIGITRISAGEKF